MTWFHLRRVCLQKVEQPFFGRPWPICPKHDSNHLKARAVVPLQPPASAMSFDLRAGWVPTVPSLLGLAMQSRVWSGRVGGSWSDLQKVWEQKEEHEKTSLATLHWCLFWIVLDWWVAVSQIWLFNPFMHVSSSWPLCLETVSWFKIS